MDRWIVADCKPVWFACAKKTVVSNVFSILQLRKPRQLRKVTVRGIWNLIVLHLGKHHTFYYTWLVIS